MAGASAATPSLDLIWLVTAVLAVFAALLLLGLLTARVIRNRLLARRARQRAQIAQALIVTSRSDGSNALRRHGRHELLVAETAQGLADLVRGPELERIRDALVRYDIPPRLIRRLRRGRKRQRVVAAEALALTPSPEVAEALRAATADRAAEVRLAALFSLIDIEAAPTIAEILRSMGSGPWSRSLLVTDLLRRLGGEDQTVLADAMRRLDLPARIRIMLLEAVPGAGDFEVLPTVADQADDDDPAVRAAVMRAMGRLAHPSVSSKLEQALVDEDAEVRRDAVVAVQRAGLQDLAPRIGRLIEDEVWEVRHAAARALREMGVPGRRALQRALSTTRGERRRELAASLLEQPAW